MTVYFLSSTPAALRLNGAYMGVIDGIVRRVEVGEGEPLFVEAVPSDNRMPVNFMLDDNFLAAPPPFADLYLMGSDVLVKIKRYGHKDTALRPIFQTHFCGNLITLCRRGDIALCVDRSDGSYDIFELDDGFSAARPAEGNAGGHPVLCIYSQSRLAIISEGGKLVFNNRVKSYSLGDMLGVTVDFESCAGAVGECSYSYDGGQFTLVSGRTVETRPVGDDVRHFAFFESILTHADASAYLCGELRDRAGELSAYLGEFVDVVIPPQKFYQKTGEERAAGLVYAVAPNLYRVKFYAADIKCGLVENIREVEY